MRLYNAIKNYEAAMKVYCQVWTAEQWQVVCNAHEAVIAIATNRA
jgi:hypothetical protein